MIVIDTSALIEALVGSGAAGLAVVARIEGERVVAPELIDVEAVNTLNGLVLGGKLQPERAARAVDALGVLPVERVPHVELVGRIWQLRHNLTAYDAAYVALAERLGAVLVTGDAHLAAAAGIRCRVEVIG